MQKLKTAMNFGNTYDNNNNYYTRLYKSNNIIKLTENRKQSV